MATYTGSFEGFFNEFMDTFGDGTAVDLGAAGDALTCHLMKSTWTPDATDTWAGISTNEEDETGYPGAHTLASKTWSARVFNAGDATFAMSGSNVTSTRWLIKRTTSNILVCYGRLDATPGDVTTTDGNTLTVQWNASGIFSLS